MRKPELYVMLRKADGKTEMIRLANVRGYTHDSVIGYAGDYQLSGADRKRLTLNEEYVFWTDNYRYEDINGKKYIGQKEGSVGAVPIMPDKSGAPGENYSALLRTHGLTAGYKTLKGEKKLPVGMVIIIVVAVLACMATFYFMRSCGVEEVADGVVPVEVEDSQPKKVE